MSFGMSAFRRAQIGLNYNSGANIVCSEYKSNLDRIERMGRGLRTTKIITDPIYQEMSFGSDPEFIKTFKQLIARLGITRVPGHHPHEIFP
jgi:hypothetical protein